MTARPEITVSSRVVGELVLAVERAGVPRREFHRAAGIDAAWLEDDGLRVPTHDVLACCQVAIDVTHDPAFGLHWGEWLTSNAFNLVSHLVAHATNLREAIDALHRFGELVSDSIGIELVEQGDTAELRRDEMAGQPVAIRRLLAEMQMLGYWRLIQHYGGPDARVTSVCFRHGAPFYRQEYTRLFGGAERFEQPFMGIVFDRALLSAPSPRNDDELYTSLTDLAAQRLLRRRIREPYCVRVREHLLQQRAPHRVALAEVARGLELSARSLQRRLKEEGQSYVSLANQASAQVAKQLLLQQGQSIQETAHRMGFTRVGSFHRAFRRWTGTTPGTVRAGLPEPRARQAGCA